MVSCPRNDLCNVDSLGIFASLFNIEQNVLVLIHGHEVLELFLIDRNVMAARCILEVFDVVDPQNLIFVLDFNAERFFHFDGAVHLGNGVVVCVHCKNITRVILEATVSMSR